MTDSDQTCQIITDWDPTSFRIRMGKKFGSERIQICNTANNFPFTSLLLKRFTADIMTTLLKELFKTVTYLVIL